MKKSFKFIGIVIVLLTTVLAVSCTKKTDTINPTSHVDYSKIQVVLKVLSNPIGGAKRPYGVTIKNENNLLVNAQLNFKQTLFYPFPPFETKNEEFLIEKDLNSGMTNLGEQLLSFEINSVEVNGHTVDFEIIE